MFLLFYNSSKIFGIQVEMLINKDKWIMIHTLIQGIKFQILLFWIILNANIIN
jgi:hypothetical protein